MDDDVKLIWESYSLITEDLWKMEYDQIIRWADENRPNLSDKEKIKVINTLLNAKYKKLEYGPLEAQLDDEGIFIQVGDQKIRNDGTATTSSPTSTARSQPEPEVEPDFVRSHGKFTATWFDHAGGPSDDWKSKHASAVKIWKQQGGPDVSVLNDSKYDNAVFWFGSGEGIDNKSIPDEYFLYRSPWRHWHPTLGSAAAFLKSIDPKMVSAWAELTGKPYAKQTPDGDLYGQIANDPASHYPGSSDFSEMEEWLGTKTPIGRKWVMETDASIPFSEFFDELEKTGLQEIYWDKINDHPGRASRSPWEIPEKEKFYFNNETAWPTPQQARQSPAPEERRIDYGSDDQPEYSPYEDESQEEPTFWATESFKQFVNRK